MDWHNFVREVCEEDLQRNPIQLGGLDQNGARRVVEIDECVFSTEVQQGCSEVCMYSMSQLRERQTDTETDRQTEMLID